MRFLHIILFQFCFSVLAAPGILYKEVPGKGKDSDFQLISAKVNFYSCTLDINMKQILNNKVKIFSYIGFINGFGRTDLHAEVYNGGWSSWGFFDEKKKLPAREREVDNILFQELDGAVELVIEFKPDSGKSQTPPSRWTFVQFREHPVWLFLRVESNSADTLQFTAVPGGSHWNIPERERLLISHNGEFSLAKNKAEFMPQGSGLVFTNRSWHESFGQLLIFEPDKIQSMEATKTDNFITVNLHPVPGKNVFVFALGFFANQNQKEAVERFLKEQCETTGSVLKNMVWTRKTETAAVRYLLDDTNLILQKLQENRNDISVQKAELSRMNAECRDDMDTYEASALLRRIRAFRDVLCKEALQLKYN